MKKLDVYNLEGKKVADVSLSETVFGVESNDVLVHQVYVAQSANRRSGSSHTKIRSDVRGGGKKPWKQKGTGNARTGSIRNPIWRGGGIIFGPLKEKNYSKGINEKMKRKALVIALSEKARSEKIRIVDSLLLEDKKTKVIAGMMKGIGIEKTAIVGFSNAEAGCYKAARNINKVNAMATDQLNVYDVMNAEYLVVSQDSLKQIEAKYAA